MCFEVFIESLKRTFWNGSSNLDYSGFNIFSNLYRYGAEMLRWIWMGWVWMSENFLLSKADYFTERVINQSLVIIFLTESGVFVLTKCIKQINRRNEFSGWCCTTIFQNWKWKIYRKFKNPKSRNPVYII